MMHIVPRSLRRAAAILLLAAAALAAGWPSPVRTLGCQYQVNGRDICWTVVVDGVNVQDRVLADQFCRSRCEDIAPQCTNSRIVDNCPIFEDVAPVIELDPPIVYPNDIPLAVGNTVGAVVGVIGALTFLVFFYGGFVWLTSAGNEDRIKVGRDAMLWAVIGLFVIFASYIVLRSILEAITR